MKKRIVMVTASILLVVGIVCWQVMPPSYSHTMKINWGVSLPVKALCTEVYEKDSGSSFHGDGIRYHVFSYKYEDYIDLMFAWTSTEYPTNYYATTSEAAEAWLDEIDVPDDKRPDYTNCCLWHKSKEDNSEIIFFWDNEQNLIYIVENFL